MRLNYRFATAKFLALFLLGPLLLPAVFVTLSGLNSVDTSVVDPVGNVEPSEVDADENTVQIWFQLTSFDPALQIAQFNVYPWPSDDLATPFTSSTILKKYPMRIWIDESRQSQRRTYAANSTVGAIPVEFDVVSGDEKSSNDSRYPFDSYVLDTYATAEMNFDQNGESDQFKSVKSYDFFYTNSYPGFQIKYQRTGDFEPSSSEDPNSLASIESQRKDGKISFIAEFSRSNAVKIIAMIIGLCLIMNIATLTWIVTKIWSGKRPPSMQALVWSAASFLGTLQLRQVLPGNPRIGIAMDFIFFFPALFVGLISSVLLTSLWIRRDDWII
jgi:hypothetical protein